MAAASLSFVPLETRYACAELVPVSWSAAARGAYSEYALLAEIWCSGGVFLVEAAAEPGTVIRVSLPETAITGVVRRCRQERCSYALEVQIDAPGDWFGGRYRPDVLSPSEVRGLRAASDNGRARHSARR